MFNLEELFMHHAPTGEQVVRLACVREAAHDLASVILANTVPGADQSAAIRKVREATMTANASIVLEGRHAQ